jgi:glycosyltransferase involved in cell wall biosynthesis
VSLRVLSVAYPFAPVAPDAVGGAEAVLARIDAGLCERGASSAVVARAGSSVRGRLYAVPPCEGPLTDERRRELVGAVGDALAGALDREDPDIVHLHGYDFTSYLPAHLGRAASRAATVVTLHLPLAWYSSDVVDLRERGVRLVCVSDDQRRRGGPRWSSVPVIENGVAGAGGPPAGDDPDRREDFGLCLGRICPEKGFHLALAAAHQAGVSLVLAGTVYPYPDHERYFTERVAPLLDARRRFIGPVAGAAKERLLRRARFVVVPSLVDETSSLVAMEALAAGTPVVARAVGALPTIVEHGRTGWLADRVDELALAFQRTHLLRAEDCLAAARARFDAARMVGSYVELYRTLTRKTGPAKMRAHMTPRHGTKARWDRDRFAAEKDA